MKKVFKISLFLIVMLFFCTGCEGDVTRALRHDGFSIGSDFECEFFFRKENGEKVRYLTSNNIITSDGKIYDVSLGQKFSNNFNCKLADTTLKVVSIFDNKIFKAEDGKLYTLVGDNNAQAFGEVTSSDNSYALYNLLLSQEGTIKVMTADSSTGIYYVLKSDGNVYGVTIIQPDRNVAPTIAGSVIVYNSSDFGGAITDFNYSGDSPATFVRTSTRAFRMVSTNYEECSKYADIPCNYQMMESSAISEYGDYILAYNGNTVITTYKKIFTITG